MNQEEGIWHMVECAVESGDISEVTAFIDSDMSLIDQHLEFIRANLGTTGRNLVLYNLLAKVNQLLYCLRFSLNGPTELIAFVTRYLFELNLTTRYVLSSEENLMRFVAESGIDKIQILEGLSELRKFSSKRDARGMQEELTRLRASTEKFDLRLKKPNSFMTKARTVGAELEYKALYKVFSKYIHPSSYSINLGYQGLFTADQLRIVFLSWALLFAGIAFHEAKQATVGSAV